jgi:anti-anti-sigma regulatory factor
MNVGGQVNADQQAVIALIENLQRADLCLAAAQPRVENILKISGLTSIVQVFPTLDEAIASFGSQAFEKDPNN